MTSSIIKIPQKTSENNRYHDREVRSAIIQVNQMLFSNYRGAFTCGTTTSSVTVVFAGIGLSNQADALYDIFLYPTKENAGPSSVGSRIILDVFRSAGGFVVSFAATPGTGSIDWAWKIIANTGSEVAIVCHRSLLPPVERTMASAVIPIPQKTGSNPRTHDREVKSAITQIRRILDSNYNGEFTVPSTDSFYFIVFSDIGLPDQPDLFYDVLFTPTRTISGPPTVNSRIIKEVNVGLKTVVIDFMAAPGIGSVVWSWKLIRHV